MSELIRSVSASPVADRFVRPGPDASKPPAPPAPVQVELPLEWVEPPRSRRDARAALSGSPEPSVPAEPLEHGASTAIARADSTGRKRECDPNVRGTEEAHLDRFARWVAVAGGAGLVPVAPGTAGSALAAAIYLVLFGVWTRAAWLGWAPDSAAHTIDLRVLLIVGPLAMIALVGCLGVWAANRAEAIFGCKDDGRIVIDEVFGQWIALLPVPLLVGTNPLFFELLAAVVTGFVLFRLFDVWKPGLIRWAERRFRGGLGVMADDGVAGVHAALALWLMGQGLLGQGLPGQGLMMKGLMMNGLP